MGLRGDVKERVTGRVWAMVPYVLCVFVGGAFLVGWQYLHEMQRGREEARFREYSDLLVQETTTRVRETVYLAKSFAGLMMGLENATDARLWSSYYAYRGVRENFPWITVVSYCPHVPAGEVDAHVGRVRDGGMPEYAIYPDGARDYYVPVKFVEPLEANAKTLGYDAASDPVRKACMEAARALRAKRPYKPAMEHDEVARMLREGAGKDVDPAVVDAFNATEQECTETYGAYARKSRPGSTTRREGFF